MGTAQTEGRPLPEFAACEVLRRTCATHFQKHGKPRDIQAQLRHSRLEMTGRYVKEIPGQVRAAVESMDCESKPGHRAGWDGAVKVTTLVPDTRMLFSASPVSRGMTGPVTSHRKRQTVNLDL